MAFKGKTIKQLIIAIIIIFCITGISASDINQKRIIPPFTDMNKKNVCVWIIIYNDNNRKTFIKMTIDTETLKKSYEWVGTYNGIDIFRKK